MRPVTLYFLAQARSSRTGHQFPREDAPPCSVREGRHARVPRRDHPRRGLPAITRRVRAVLNGT
jgi:hypothetical protein